MSAAQHESKMGRLNAAELAATIASTMDAEARRYLERTTELRQALKSGQVQRRAAWEGTAGQRESERVLVTA
jgi:hypothetical protein